MAANNFNNNHASSTARLMLAAVAAAVLLALATGPSPVAAQSGPGGECEADVPPPLVTINPPIPADAALVDGVFALEVASALTAGRDYVGATFNGAPAPECNFPGGDFSASIDAVSCSDVFAAAVDFVTLTAPMADDGCGFTLDTAGEAGTALYSGLYAVTLEDVVAGTRSGTAEIRSSTFQWFVDIALPTEVSVTTSVVEVLAPVQLSAVIVRQDVDVAAGTLTVDFLTEVQHPFLLTDFDTAHDDPYTTIAVADAVGADATSFNADYTCLNADGAPCFQLTTLVLSRNEACTYDGDYLAAVTVVCADGASCPLDGGSALAWVSFTLATDDVCERIRVEEAGSLSASATPRDGIAYLDGQVAVFDVVAVSTAALIASTTVDPTAAWMEVGNPANTGTTAAAIATTGPSSNSAAVAISAAAFNVPADTSLRIAFTFQVGVTYVDGARRRALLQSEGSSTEAMSTLSISPAGRVDGEDGEGDDDGPAPGPEAPPTVTPVVGMAAMFVGAAAMCAGVVFIVLARRSSEEESSDDGSDLGMGQGKKPSASASSGGARWPASASTTAGTTTSATTGDDDDGDVASASAGSGYTDDLYSDGSAYGGYGSGGADSSADGFGGYSYGGGSSGGASSAGSWIESV